MSKIKSQLMSKELLMIIAKLKVRLYQLFVFPVQDDWDVAWNTALGCFSCEFFKIASGSSSIDTTMNWAVKEALKYPYEKVGRCGA